jgi:CHAD domain-containing protein
VLRDRDHTAPRAASAGPIQRSTSCVACFQRIASHCLQAIESNRKLAVAGDPEAVHRMRIELTRLRAAALFFVPVTEDAAWPGIDRQLRWLNSALGRARNRDVAIECANRKHYRRWAAPSHRNLLRSRDKAHRRLSKKLGSARYGSLTSELHHWISYLASPHGKQTQQLDVRCDERLRDWRDEISRQERHVRVLHRKPLHRLRIQSKRYRYVVEALLDHDIPVSREDFLFCATAKQVHQALGELRDLRLLRKAIGRRPPHYRRHKLELIQRVASLC